MKFLTALILLFSLTGCYKKPTDHDLRVAAKKFIRKQLISPSTAKFAPDDQVKIIREKGDKTFYVSIYADAQNGAGAVVRRQWYLHLLYKGGSLPDIRNWEILPEKN